MMKAKDEQGETFACTGPETRATVVKFHRLRRGERFSFAGDRYECVYRKTVTGGYTDGVDVYQGYPDDDVIRMPEAAR
jgi:hypothetical protein